LLSTATPEAVRALERKRLRQMVCCRRLWLGQDLAETVGASVGDRVTLVSPQAK